MTRSAQLGRRRRRETSRRSGRSIEWTHREIPLQLQPRTERKDRSTSWSGNWVSRVSHLAMNPKRRGKLKQAQIQERPDLLTDFSAYDWLIYPISQSLIHVPINNIISLYRKQLQVKWWICQCWQRNYEFHLTTVSFEKRWAVEAGSPKFGILLIHQKFKAGAATLAVGFLASYHPLFISMVRKKGFWLWSGWFVLM